VIDNGAEDLCPEDDELAELRWHWDSAYVIHCRDGEWTALFRDDLTVLTAESADSLRQLIWDDYIKRKLPPKTLTGDRAPMVSKDDLNRILLTTALSALRFTIGTHGVHLARSRRCKRDAITDDPDESQNVADPDNGSPLQ
jgi:hypothetical protein